MEDSDLRPIHQRPHLRSVFNELSVEFEPPAAERVMLWYFFSAYAF
jgi:hypothetical protein